MSIGAEFAEEVRRNWGNPLGLGKIIFRETEQDGRFAPNHDTVERAVEIGMIIEANKGKSVEAFLAAYEEMATAALSD